MQRLAAIAALAMEFVKYLFASSGDGAGQPFRDYLLVKLMEARIRNDLRSFAAAYVIVSALNGGAYDTAFRTIKTLSGEIRWENMSSELLRRIFEVAIIHDELWIAKRVLSELSTKSVATGANAEAEPLKCLIEWRSGRVQNESSIDLDRKYFVAYPAYDEYFKGRILSSTGRLSEAKAHFERCLALAPENARELREDVLRRM
jgi:hypothetical protein